MLVMRKYSMRLNVKVAWESALELQKNSEVMIVHEVASRSTLLPVIGGRGWRN